MHHASEKKYYAGIAATLAVLFLTAIFAVWMAVRVNEARVFGCIVAIVALAVSILLIMAARHVRTWVQERDSTNRQLHRSEEMNSRMIEGSDDCIAVLDAKGRLMMVNSAMWQWIEEVGLKPVEKLPWVDTWAGEPRRAAESVLASALSGKVGRFEGLSYVRSGEGRWYDVTVTPICDAAGKPEKILAVSRNITQSRCRGRVK